MLGKNYLGTNKALLSRLRMICSPLSLLTDSHWSSMRAYWDQSGMGYGMDIRIQLLPTNEVPQESAKTGPGISDLCSRVCVGSSVLTLWQGIFQTFVINFLFSPTQRQPHSSLQLQSSISTKEMKTRLGFYMHRTIHIIHNLPSFLSLMLFKYRLKASLNPV